jgi:hypothetical protein
MGDFEFYRQPHDYQRQTFERSKDAEFWACFYDPRCGKSKITLDTFRYNYANNRVTALVVIAFPSDVHLVWGDEVPKDFPPDFMAQTKMLVWRRGKMSGRAGVAAMNEVMAHDGPKVVTLNCEAIMTDLAWNFLRKFWRKNKVMLVVDEDWAINWTARTRRLLAMGKNANTVMRRLLTGTPAEEGPHNLYYPTTFLKPGCLGFTSMTAFKNRYFEYEQEEDGQRKKGFNRKTNTEFDILKGYQHLEELQQKLSKFSDRVVRKGSTKIYSHRYFELTPKQRRAYDKLRDEYSVELTGVEFSVGNVLTRMTRLQMVARNYWPPTTNGEPCPFCMMTGYLETGDECNSCQGLGMIISTTDFERIDDRSPALEALVEELRYSHRPFVVWARFQQDVSDALEAALTVYPGRVARFDGSVPQADRVVVYRAFQEGALDGIVATEKSSLSRGHDLRRAKLMVYYSNEWSGRDRRQSEDRAESTDTEDWTDIVDLVAADTRDLDVIGALQQKKSIGEMITGNGVRAVI